MRPEALVIVIIAVGIASYVQTTTGMGFALIVSPFLVLLLETRVAILVLLCLHSLQCSGGLVVEHSRASWRTMRPLLVPMILGGALGAPFGAIALQVIDPTALRISIGTVVVVSGVLILLTGPRPMPAPRAGSVAAGFLSGALNSGTGLSGPPLAVYLGNQGWNGAEFRTAMLAALLATNLISLAIHLAVGTPAAGAPVPIAMLAPAVVAGVLIAARQARSIGRTELDEKRLRTLIGSFVIVAGLVSILDTLVLALG